MSSDLHFYCQNIVGDQDFSIDEWNQAYEQVQAGILPDSVLRDPPPCDKQCNRCAAIVSETREMTKALRSGPEDIYLEQKSQDAYEKSISHKSRNSTL